MYPTISNAKIKIAYKLNANVRKIRIDIKDSSGKTIRNIEGNTNYGESEIEEEVGNFANGVYFIKIKATRQDGKEDIVIKKFVVVK